MVNPGPLGPDRALILRTVTEADRRLRAARYLREIVTGSTLILYAAFTLLVLAHVLPVAPAIAYWSAAAGLIAFAGGRAWWLARRPDPARAASAVDVTAGLHDELVSAHWFAGQGAASSWEELHVQRAAGTASRLDLAGLLPLAVTPRAAGRLAVAAVLLVAVGFIPVQRTRIWAGGAPVTLTDAERARLDEIARLLPPDAGRSPERAALQARIDELLRKLREGGLSPEDTLTLVDELRQLLGAAAGSGSALTDALARTGEALDDSALTAPIAEALKRHATGEAARRMRDLASAIDEAMRGGSLADLQSTLNHAASQAQGGFDRLASDLAGAAADIARRGSQDAKGSLERAADDLEAAMQMQEFEQAIRNANSQLEGLEQSLGSRFGTARQAGQAAQREDQQALPSRDTTPQGSTPQPGQGPGRPVPGETGEPRGTMTVASDQPGSSAPGPLGAPSIAAAGAPMKIDVTRRREVLPVEPPPGEPPRDRMVDEDTRATRATVPYSPVATTPPYAGADRLTPDEVPAPYRDLVKAYFRLLGPRGSKDR